jgi:hypothetical protein
MFFCLGKLFYLGTLWGRGQRARRTAGSPELDAFRWNRGKAGIFLF